MHGGFSASGGRSRKSSKTGGDGGISMRGPVHQLIFLVEKKDGSYRPVINLKPLNTTSLHETLISSNGLLHARDLRCIMYLDNILAMH